MARGDEIDWCAPAGGREPYFPPHRTPRGPSVRSWTDYIMSYERPSVKQQRYTFAIEHGFRVTATFSMHVEMRFTGAPRIPDATQDLSGLHTISGVNRYGSLLQMRQADIDIGIIQPNNNVIASWMVIVSFRRRQIG